MAEGRRRVGSLGFVVGALVAVPATVFAVSNLETTSVQFLGWQADVPLWIVIGVSVLAGFIIGAGVTAAVQARRRRTRKKRAKADTAPPEDSVSRATNEPPTRADQV
jgi:uncharacterized integral membrane protein